MRAFLRKGYWQFLYVLAYVWRRLLWRTTFIAITGSVGKTTTKECLFAILRAHSRTAKTLNNQNDYAGVPASILRVRPWHRFAVIEVGTVRPGLIRRSARLVRPDIAVVLAVARTHTTAFATLEETAAEKAELLAAVPRSGVAILNASDPRVQEMADGCRCEVRTFGLCEGLDLWADEISSQWPARLTLKAHTVSETLRVETNLVGVHWVNAVLAALMVAHACGVPLKSAAADIARVKPFTARMQPVVLPSGATLIRDEGNGSPDTLTAAFRFLGDSIATRRILVLSDLSDSRKRPRDRLKEIGKIAAGVADSAMFVGEHGKYAVKAAVAAGMPPESVRSVVNLPEAARYLKSTLRAGDVVLLKGRGTDHLSRIVLAQFGEIGCWKFTCSKTILCDLCDQLRPEFDLRSALPAESRRS